MKIAIIGIGKMGAWFNRQLSRNNEVAVYDTDPDKTIPVENVIRLDQISKLKTFQPEILLNAVNLQNTVPVFEELSPYLPSGCVLVDMTSIKGDIPKYYQKCPFAFASIHPMFGPYFANLNSLKGENAIIIEESDAKSKDFFRQFFSQFEINIYECSFNRHDELMAYSLTLPFASSIVFTACLTTQTVPGTTFARHRDIAQKLLKEDDYLLTEVLFNPHSLKQLENICHRLEFLKHVIRARDYEESYRFLENLRDHLKSNGEKNLNSR